MEAGTKRPHLKVRSWLTGLKKLSLLLGTMLDGFFMHDIVRDYAISRCEELAALQRRMIETVLAARPEPNGWVLGPGLQNGTPEWYVVTHGHHHVRGAVAEVLEARDVALVRSLTSTAELGLAAACAQGVGIPRMVELAEDAKRDGAWSAAARLLFASSLLARVGMRPQREEAPLLQGAQLLLQGKLDGDDEATVFEFIVVTRLLLIDGGGEASTRLDLLQVRMQERGLHCGSGATTVLDKIVELGNQSFGMACRFIAPLKFWGSATPEEMLTVPSEEDVAQAVRLYLSCHTPWKARVVCTPKGAD